VDVAGGGFFQGETFSDYFRGSSNLSRTVQTARSWLQQGYGVTLGIYGPGGHGITAWGVRYDRLNSNRIAGIYITDSDDNKSSTDAPDKLRYYKVRYSGGRWYLTNYFGSNSWYIGVVQGLARRGNASGLGEASLGGVADSAGVSADPPSQAVAPQRAASEPIATAAPTAGVVTVALTTTAVTAQANSSGTAMWIAQAGGEQTPSFAPLDSHAMPASQAGRESTGRLAAQFEPQLATLTTDLPFGHALHE
jgi:hypothetical protein